jgi:hypothetical protein
VLCDREDAVRERQSEDDEREDVQAVNGVHRSEAYSVEKLGGKKPAAFLR